MNKKSRNEKGITLVALVVTVIVIMILAGITLTLVLGQNGIIGKAKKAKDASANADKATEEGLNNLYNEIVTETGGETIPTVASAGNNKLSDTENVQLKDDEGNTVTIPAGFHIADGSPTKQEEGIVIEDKEGNQFVWIPVANIADYKRTDFGSSIDAGGYSSYSEAMPSDEQTSVSKYHGYYIGRYEAGDKESTSNKVMRSSSVTTDTVTIKKGQAPYNYVTRDQAKILAEGMKTAENYMTTTKLCSSYGWDTAINFIQKTVSNYGTSSNQGNYRDTTFIYTDITGASQTKALSGSVLIPTGETTPVCNIYDMGGNDWEWTTEACNYDDAVYQYPYVLRGNYYDNNYEYNSAGYRGYEHVFDSDSIGFRVTLYI